ncbi:DUF4124 domain-containing protein [Dyella sp. Tek66A03]|uniref:DUF4124 domain-containing protein n=1 Tax=Dyella sp. Tek66A03 TaxID=3458298 RepID=UPI00403EF4DD
MRPLKMTAMASLALVVAGELSAQTYYKWVDANGVTHYGEQPPDKGKITTLELHPGGSESPAQPTNDGIPQVNPNDANAAEKRYRERSCSTAKNDMKVLSSNAMVVGGGSVADPADVARAKKLSPDEREAARVEAARRALEFCDRE